MAKIGSALAPMFSDVASDPVALSKRVDEFKKSMDDAPWGVLQYNRIVAGNLAVKDMRSANGGQQLLEVEKVDSASNQMTALLRDDTISKALGADQVAGIQAALAEQGTIQKDISLTSPVSTGMVLFDLKSPADFLVPVETPLVNKFPRTKGTGTSYRYKQITGFSNAQTTSGAGILHPGIQDTTQTNFAVSGSANPLYFNRPPKITWTGQDVNVAYFQFGFSDEVTFSSYFAGVDFQDPRQLSQAGLLYASKLGEERMTVYGRGPSANSAGYSGALTDPTVSIVGATAVTGQTAIPGTPTVYVWVAANSGFGSRIPVATTPASVVLTAGQVVNATITTPSNGAAKYDVYVGTAAGAANAFYYGSFSGNFTIQGTLPTTGATANQASDLSFQSFGYDGIIPVCTGPNAGYKTYLNAALSTTNPGNEFQVAFAQMYAGNLANPDEVLYNARDRKQLSDLLKIAGSTGLRLAYDADERSGRILGEVVTGLQNESTGKLVDLTVHPYMPQGVAPILTHTLPFPNSDVPSCFEYRNVQDYMGISWPQVQLSYDISSYWFGALLCRAPAWQGCISGITAA